MAEPEGKQPTLSESAAAAGLGIAMLIGGVTLIDSDLGRVAQGIGFVLAFMGLIAANTSVWAILKSLWRRN